MFNIFLFDIFIESCHVQRTIIIYYMNLNICLASSIDGLIFDMNLAVLKSDIRSFVDGRAQHKTLSSLLHIALKFIQ